MNDREEWRERVRDIRAASTIWWWWWYIYMQALMMVTETETLTSTLHHNLFTYLDYAFFADFILIRNCKYSSILLLNQLWMVQWSFGQQFQPLSSLYYRFLVVYFHRYDISEENLSFRPHIKSIKHHSRFFWENFFTKNNFHELLSWILSL